MMYGVALEQGGGWHWRLKRNCALSPNQLGLSFSMLLGVSAIVGLFSWWNGAILVLPFTIIEMFVVGAAFIFYARHAADEDRILLQSGRVVVELETAGKVLRKEFRQDRVRVEPSTGLQPLILLAQHGDSVHVGRFVRPEVRLKLMRELRQAMRGN